MAGIDGMPKWQAQLTFKMARHAIVDIAQIFNTSPLKDDGARLTSEDLTKLRLVLAQSGIILGNETGGDHTLAELRAMYEPYTKVLSQYLMMPLPGWLPKAHVTDNWQTSAWENAPAAAEQIFHKCMRSAAPAKAQLHSATASGERRD